MTALSADWINVGDVTCALNPFVFKSLDGKLQVGDVVSLSCTPRGTSPGRLSIVWSTAPKIAG
jgi:hypothetical protein